MTLKDVIVRQHNKQENNKRCVCVYVCVCVCVCVCHISKYIQSDEKKQKKQEKIKRYLAPAVYIYKYIATAAPQLSCCIYIQRAKRRSKREEAKEKNQRYLISTHTQHIHTYSPTDSKCARR